jgi:GTP-binding protein
LEIRSVQFSRGAYSSADFPRDKRPQFAIVGRSNVGKSTLINTILANRTVARVSQTPGKTQAINFFLINERFYVVDLPGYGYAKAAKAVIATWGALVHSYIEQSPDLRVVFVLFDSRRTPSEEDLTMVAWMDEAGIPWRAILTKVDKLSGNELARSMRTISQSLGIDKNQLIPFSKNTKQGVDAIWREIDAVQSRTQ